ncbi:YiiX/YebB-like N1pC/P60 family cysteine hydrolase [Chryseobacterium pennipullorum]|uniref:Permuted papain-like amidase enzyme, YaeF/YiiX, C92 family n=1 Tax=Chryseobacterium pennipullorum TaxID=2258963 RepID=A0A3D9B2S8_9FLAO|nr:YiiX/YebB-like N1pC/P60 family cysteine hydrolase [Chryseobacterium pennipullorum]REC47925.1 hypothetical protein DRF67_08495 [Chryseobacterium pennipullorum]
MPALKIPVPKKFKKTIIPLLLVFLVIVSVQCLSQRNTANLQNGDLLFVTAEETGLSGAINNVTQKKEVASFDHIGILEVAGSDRYVLHAAPKGGAQRQNLNEFIKDQEVEGQRVVVYRLKPQYRKFIPDAIQKAHSMLGKPYNFDYILDENSYYCSDFVERAFRKNHIFILEPMTFIDPKTRKTNTFWEEFYNKKNIQVPEGEPGCNPNGLAGSDKLERVGDL